MKKRGKHQQNQPSASLPNRAELLAMLAEKDSQLKEQNALLNTHQKHLSDKDQLIKKQQQYIRLMEEQLHLVTLRKFAASSEKMPWQADLFDEAELEFIPAQMKVLEYWQEKAVFERAGEESIVVAPRPLHPLGKCFATPSLLAHIITAKYADGLPLYRTENILKRYGAEVSRTNMANWVIRLLDGFSGVLQTDGYAGYNKVCKGNGLMRLGCWDHARRKFVEAVRVAKPTGKKGKKSKAEQAVTQIGKLYAVEKAIKDLGDEEKKRIRQEKSLPLLNEFKLWLKQNKNRILQGSQTHKGIIYCLNQWDYLTGYCEEGRFNISNILTENAIRPFAVGRKAWLFADTSKGAHASATCYSLVETAKANGLEPFFYILHLLTHIANADTVEKLEALLPWNVDITT